MVFLSVHFFLHPVIGPLRPGIGLLAEQGDYTISEPVNKTSSMLWYKCEGRFRALCIYMERTLCAWLERQYILVGGKPQSNLYFMPVEG